MSKYSEAELNEFYKRREEFLSGESKGYSVQESHTYIRDFVNKIQERPKQSKKGKLTTISAKNLQK